MAMKQANLPELVDSYGRTADTEFNFGVLLEFLNERLDRVDEAEAYDLAASSGYLFESWENPSDSVFIPRRMFFQGAEFRITPSREEVEGGFLFPGHHFIPFVSREVFPGDLWLVLPDGSAPHVRRMDLPRQATMESLALFGEIQALEYLVSDDTANEGGAGSVSVTAYDLRGFYAENNFKPGDSLMVRVLDWLQGVFAVSCAPARQPADAVDIRDWTLAMRAAYDRMQFELGTEGDCYEQLAVMLLLAQESEIFPVMKNPPRSILGFIREQDDIVINQLADRAVLYVPGEQVSMNDLAKLMSPLDFVFKELGLSCSEAEAEAYMRDALFHGLEDPDVVLGRIVAGRSLVFRSADDQEEFHQLWNTLWEDVDDVYMRDLDSHAKLRTDLLLLNDQCFALMRGIDRQAFDSQKLAENPYFKDFGMLTASLSSLLGLLNIGEDEWEVPDENLNEIASVLFDKLPNILDELKKV